MRLARLSLVLAGLAMVPPLGLMAGPWSLILAIHVFQDSLQDRQRRGLATTFAAILLGALTTILNYAYLAFLATLWIMRRRYDP